MSLPLTGANAAIPSPDTLDAYLARGSYELQNESFESYGAVCEALGAIATPAIVAIDGPTNSGKTSFANALVDFYIHSGVPAALLHLDYFLVDRETRNSVFQSVARGDLDIASYSRAAWEQERYGAFLAAARKILALSPPEPQTLDIPGAYSRLTGKKEDSRSVAIHPKGILVTEGVGIHTYHENLSDLKIRIDVGRDNVLLQRVLLRERHKPPGARLTDEYLHWRYKTVDGPHTAHLRVASAGKADFVINASDFNNMIVYRKQLNAGESS